MIKFKVTDNCLICNIKLIPSILKISNYISLRLWEGFFQYPNCNTIYNYLATKIDDEYYYSSMDNYNNCIYLITYYLSKIKESKINPVFKCLPKQFQTSEVELLIKLNND